MKRRMMLMLCIGVLPVLARHRASLGQAASLSEPEQSVLAELASKQVHEFRGHAELAEYLRLRAKERKAAPPAPADAIADFALRSIGQSYRRNAWMHDLSEADCVTFTERCIAVGCTDTWLGARKLQHRLRYRDGNGNRANMNHEPILDWIPANSWLFDEITAAPGVPLVEFDAYYEGRSQRVSYIPKDALLKVGEHLRSGDILLAIGETANPPTDPVVRTRCVHMAILYKADGVTPVVELLHSYPPAASRWPIERLFRNRYIRGAKILRLKPDARAIVATELARFADRFNATANQVDNEARLRKGEFGFIPAIRRAPDQIVTIEGVEYGLVQLKPGETLWSLFGPAYKSVCRMPVNQPFMARHPDLRAEDYAGDSIYYARRMAGDSLSDPRPPQDESHPDGR